MKKSQIESAIHSHGYVDLGRLVSDSALSAANELISSQKLTPGFRHFIDGAAKDIAELLREGEEFRSYETLCREISQSFVTKNYGAAANQSSPFYVIRCVDSKSSGASHLRHFDSHAMTLLIPFMTSTAENAGDLVIYPFRNSPPSSGRNFLRKIRNKAEQHTSLVRRQKKTEHDLAVGTAVQIRGQAGHVYFFNGFLTQHCNFGVSRGERRSLLIHDYAPPVDFAFGALFRGARRLT